MLRIAEKDQSFGFALTIRGGAILKVTPLGV